MQYSIIDLWPAYRILILVEDVVYKGIMDMVVLTKNIKIKLKLSLSCHVM